MHTTLIADIVQVSDNLYKFENVFFSSQKFLVPGKTFINIGAEVGVRINNLISTGNDVFINKEHIKDNYDIQETDLIINEVNTIEQNKRIVYYKIVNLINYKFSTITAVEMYNLFSLLSELAFKGYFITEENWDSISIQILETNDEKLYEIFENYMLLKNKIDLIINDNKNFNNLLNELNSIETQEELDTFIEMNNIK